MKDTEKTTVYYCKGCRQYYNILTGRPEKPPEDLDAVNVHHIMCNKCFKAAVADVKAELDALKEGARMLIDYPTIRSPEDKDA